MQPDSSSPSTRADSKESRQSELRPPLLSSHLRSSCRHFYEVVHEAPCSLVRCQDMPGEVSMPRAHRMSQARHHHRAARSICRGEASETNKNMRPPWPFRPRFQGQVLCRNCRLLSEKINGCCAVSALLRRHPVPQLRQGVQNLDETGSALNGLCAR